MVNTKLKKLLFIILAIASITAIGCEKTKDSGDPVAVTQVPDQDKPPILRKYGVDIDYPQSWSSQPYYAFSCKG